MERVGIKELRQNASSVIRHVEESGVGVEVTVQGRPAALIVPLTGAGRKFTISSEEAEMALTELRHGDARWAREARASRSGDAIEDPWQRYSNS